MKSLQIILFLFFAVLVNNQVEAQRRPAARHHHHHAVKRSRYRPAVARVYHPHWGPNRSFHRRWVYFPGHRLYWDNWRQVYFYHNGRKWISSPKPPANLANVNLDNEQHQELEESFDDDDEIYLHQEK